MHFRFMTPHQFESVRQYVDTLMISTFTPLPLDIAVPFAASEWISQLTTQEASNRFRGRVSTLHGGAGTTQWFLSHESVQALSATWMHPVQFALVVTDRTLLQEELIYQVGEVKCIVFDWWQWLRARVPAHRLCDALMFLCHACPEYWESPERTTLGIDSPVAESMRREGEKLLGALTDALAERLMAAWSL